MDYSEIKSLVETKLRERCLSSIEALKEAGTFKIVNRVRKGRIQRRKKVSTRDQYTYRNGKLTRMSAQERRRRKISQRKAARKRKAKMGKSNRRRRISVRRTKRLGNLRK